MLKSTRSRRANAADITVSVREGLLGYAGHIVVDADLVPSKSFHAKCEPWTLLDPLET